MQPSARTWNFPAPTFGALSTDDEYSADVQASTTLKTNPTAPCTRMVGKLPRAFCSIFTVFFLKRTDSGCVVAPDTVTVLLPLRQIVSAVPLLVAPVWTSMSFVSVSVLSVIVKF